VVFADAGAVGRAKRARPGVASITASLLLHALFAAAFFGAGAFGAPPEQPFRVYRVNIVSPPPKAAGELPEVMEAPTAARMTAPPPERTPQVTESPKPEPPKKPEPKPEPKKPEPGKTALATSPGRTDTKPTTGPNPDPKVEVGGAGLNVQLEGEAFPFPGYLENVIYQIRRFFRWTGDQRLAAEVYFVIRRDGTVEDLRLVRGSGDFTFNLEAMGAVEQAGKRKAFGPLPEGFQGDRLPILFSFEPAR